MQILLTNSFFVFKWASWFQRLKLSLSYLSKALKCIGVKLLPTKCISLLILCLLPEIALASAENTREKIKTMREHVLAQLYNHFPDIEDDLIKASGYAVFSQNNFLVSNQEVGLLPSHIGRGIVTDNTSGNETYMKVKGPLAQVKSANKEAFNTVIIFHNPKTLAHFVRKGWDFSDQNARLNNPSDLADIRDVSLAVWGAEVIYLTKNKPVRNASVMGHQFWLDSLLNYK